MATAAACPRRSWRRCPARGHAAVMVERRRRRSLSRCRKAAALVTLVTPAMAATYQVRQLSTVLNETFVIVYQRVFKSLPEGFSPRDTRNAGDLSLAAFSESLAISGGVCWAGKVPIACGEHGADRRAAVLGPLTHGRPSSVAGEGALVHLLQNLARRCDVSYHVPAEGGWADRATIRLRSSEIKAACHNISRRMLLQRACWADPAMLRRARWAAPPMTSRFLHELTRP